MSYGTCETCGKFGDMKYHKCPPQWEVCCPDYDETCWMKFYARDAEEAAEKAAEKLDEDEHDLMKGDEIEVLVRKYDEPEAEEVKFCCTGEAIPAYYADEIKEVAK